MKKIKEIIFWNTPTRREEAPSVKVAGKASWRRWLLS